MRQCINLREQPINPPFPFAGEIFSVSAALIWACSISAFRRYGHEVSSATLNLYKNLLAAVCLLISVVIAQPRWPVSHEVWILLATSGIVGLSLGDTALFMALKKLGAQITSAIQCLAPPMAAVGAYFFLDEPLNPKQLAGLLITVGAVCGVVLTQRRAPHIKHKTLFVSGIALAVVSAVGQGAGLVLSRKAMQFDVDALSGTLMRLLPAIVVLFGTQLFSHSCDQEGLRRFVTTNPRRLVILSTAAFFGTFLGIVLSTAGVKYAKAGVSGALSATYPIWLIPISRFILRENVSHASLLWTCVACAGIALMFY